MKRLTVMLLLILALCLPAQAKTRYIYDNDGVISDIGALEDACGDFERSYGIEIFIVTGDNGYVDSAEMRGILRSTVINNANGPAIAIMLSRHGFEEFVSFGVTGYFYPALESAVEVYGNKNADAAAAEFISECENILLKKKPELARRKNSIKSIPTIIAAVFLPLCLVSAFIAYGYYIKTVRRLERTRFKSGAAHYVDHDNKRIHIEFIERELWE